MLNYFSSENIKYLSNKNLSVDDVSIYLRSCLTDISKKIRLPQLDFDDSLTYRKKILEEVQTPFGELKIAYIKFFKNRFTSLHTHPEFVAELVITGSMLEQCYEEVDNKLLFKNEVVHDGPLLIDKYCCEGSPHRVCAETEACEVLMITLGHNKGRSIDG